MMLTKATREYFAEIGRRGGRKSRRALSREQAKNMVAVRLARSAYRRFGPECFWPYARDLHITTANAGWVAEQLRRNGNRAAWQTAIRIQSLLSQPGFVRAIVGRDGQATKVEWALDTSWRFLPPVPDPVVGYRLHPIDLSVNKVLALAGRDEPRDFLDVIYVHRNHLSFGSLCWAAVGKDPGYSPEMLVELLARKGRYRAEDFAPLNLTAVPDIAELKHTWLEAVADARRLVKGLPPEDAGCLYWNPVSEKFVTPAGDLTRLVRHFGCQGGVLPSVGDQPPIACDRQAQHLLKEKQRPVPLPKAPGPRSKRRNSS